MYDLGSVVDDMRDIGWDEIEIVCTKNSSPLAGVKKKRGLW